MKKSIGLGIMKLNMLGYNFFDSARWISEIKVKCIFL